MPLDILFTPPTNTLLETTVATPFATTVDYGLAESTTPRVPLIAAALPAALPIEIEGIDLTILAFDAKNDRTPIGKTDLTFTLQNRGTLATGPFEVNFLYSDNAILGDTDDSIVRTVTITKLNPGDTLTRTVTVQLPVTTLNERALSADPSGQGAAYTSTNVDFLGIQIDPDNAIAEANEENNLSNVQGRGLDDITYFPWDIDGNGQVTATDAIFVINRVGQTLDSDNAAADFNRDGLITATDAIAAINRLGYSTNPTVTTPSIHTDILSSSSPTELPHINGVIADATSVSTLKAGFNDIDPSRYTNISDRLQFNGLFDLKSTELVDIFGRDLPSGSHTLHLIAEDTQGRTIATHSLILTLTPTIDLPSAPRLFLDVAELNETRAAITIAGSHHQRAFQAIKTRVDQNDWRVYDENLTDDNWNYARTWLAREASFLYLITGEQTYAQTAFDVLYAIHDDPDPDRRLPESGYGLARAATGIGFALAYDWAASGWSPEQQDYIQGKILTALDAWPTYGHPNFASPYGSNWVAVSRGAELVMMLSVGEENNREDRFNNLKFWLGEHLETAYGNTGLTQEGQGYLAYAGGFLMPAVYALRSINDTTLEAAFSAIDFEQLPLYAGAFNGAQTSLQFGVAWTGFDAEGWSSFLLDSAAPEVQPYYQYFYDHHRGINNPAPDAEKFDHRRAGTVWSVLYYPTETTALDPSGILPLAIQDSKKGSYLFRNRWQDTNDILVSLMGDFTHHRRSWDQPEAFALGLHAYDTHYFGGPIRNQDADAYSRLLVDGKTGNKSLNGEPEFFEERSTGGYAIVDGGDLYRDLGVDSAKRHLLVDFDEASGSAILSTLDQITDLESHLYTWQANLGTVGDDGGVTATTGQEGNLKTFVLEGNNNSYVKGWVLNPSNVSITAGDPLKIETTGKTTDIWVVMIVGQGAPPVASISGTGLSSELSLGDTRVYYDANLNQIVTKKR